MSIPTVINKEISSCKENSYSILKQGFKICLISNLICTILIFLLIPYYLNSWNSFDIIIYLLLLIPFLYFASFVNIFKGYFEALNDFKTSYFSSFLEDLFKLILSILFLFYLPLNISIKVIIYFIILNISEAVEFYYLLKKFKFTNLKLIINAKKTNIKLFKNSFILTLDSLINSSFIAIIPFIYYYIIEKNNIEKTIGLNLYTLINAYSLPILLNCQYLIIIMSSYLFPRLCKLNKDKTKLNNYLDKYLFIGLILSINICLYIYYYPDKILLLLYQNTYSLKYLKSFSLIFILVSLNPIFNCYLKSYKPKTLLIITIIDRLLELLLIIILTNKYLLNGLYYTYLISMLIKVILLNIAVLKYQNKLYFNLNHLIIIIIGISLYFLLPLINNYLISGIIILFVMGIEYLLFSYLYNKD